MNDDFLIRFRENPSPDFASRLQRRLNFTAVLLGGMLYGLFYLLIGAVFLPVSIFRIHLPIMAFADILYLYPRALLLSRPVPYLVTSLGSLGLAISALWVGKPGKLTRWLLVTTIVTIFIYPFTAAYQPAVIANPGYTLYNATQPPFLLGPTKSAQVGAEIHRCSCILLGWHKENLYYAEHCAGVHSNWSYSLLTHHAARISAVPDALTRNAASLSSLAVRSRNPYKIHEAAGIFTSPNGQWHAFVAQHIYGPEDVLLISTASAP